MTTPTPPEAPEERDDGQTSECPDCGSTSRDRCCRGNVCWPFASEWHPHRLGFCCPNSYHGTLAEQAQRAQDEVAAKRRSAPPRTPAPPSTDNPREPEERESGCACCGGPIKKPTPDPWDGRMDDYCYGCSETRCDAYPGACDKPTPEQAGKSEEGWTPGEVVGFCPECREEFYVPHGGKCPAQHEGETPDLIEFVPLALLTQVEEERNAERYMAKMNADRARDERARAEQAESSLQAAEAEVERVRQVGNELLATLIYRTCAQCLTPDPERKAASCPSCAELAEIIREARSALNPPTAGERPRCHGDGEITFKARAEKGKAEELLGKYGAGGTPAGLVGGIHNLAHRAEEAESRIEALKNAIGQAGYYLDPNQGERPDPVAAYQWLRTTYPEDHPNYVSPADLGPAFPLSSPPTRGDG